MNKILVVDDEPIHTREMATLIRRLRHNSQVYEAYNGIEALEIINTIPINILITDINMPEMDGLQLIESISDKLDKIMVVILSGYDYFDYAKKAMKLGACDYILKPVDEDSIHEMLLKLEERIEKKRAFDRDKLNLEEKLQFTYPLYIDHILNKWSTGNIGIREKFELQQVFQDNVKYILLALQVINTASYAYSQNKPIMIDELKDYMKYTFHDIFKSQGHQLSFFPNSESMVIVGVLKLNEENSINYKNIIQETYVDYVKKARTDKGYIIRGGASQVYDYIFKSFHIAYNEAITCLKQIQLNSSKMVFYNSKDDISNTININNVVVQECINYIYQHMAEDISVETLAEKFHFNNTYFSTIFKKSTGVGLAEFILDIRMKKAIELLKEGDCKIYEIAEQVGFRDKKYFAKVFKNKFGVTPNYYKKYPMVAGDIK